MTKVKKILETVCHSCGKIKAQTDVSHSRKHTSVFSRANLYLSPGNTNRLSTPEAAKIVSRKSGVSASPGISAKPTLRRQTMGPPNLKRHTDMVVVATCSLK